MFIFNSNDNAFCRLKKYSLNRYEVYNVYIIYLCITVFIEQGYFFDSNCVCIVMSLYKDDDFRFLSKAMGNKKLESKNFSHKIQFYTLDICEFHNLNLDRPTFMKPLLSTSMDKILKSKQLNLLNMTTIVNVDQ